MRSKNRYDIPVADGVDPAGWTAGLRRFVDDRYRLTASKSFDAALRASVRNLRRTNLPVGITVARGNHAWILTGFSATADPAATTDYEVTSVRVVGPLWGRQNRTNGYDMRPNTELTPKQLKGFFTPWHYGGVRMAWEGRWVSIQPVPVKAAAATAAPSASPTASPSPTREPDAGAHRRCDAEADDLPGCGGRGRGHADPDGGTPGPGRHDRRPPGDPPGRRDPRRHAGAGRRRRRVALARLAALSPALP